jgi:transposase-like protein
MKANIRKIQTQRYYTKEFKRSLVSEYEKGLYSVAQLSKLHGIRVQTIYSWIHKLSTFNAQGARIVEMKDSTTQKVKELQRKVKELERIVGQKQITIDYLEKMIEIAKEDFDIDIKKNFNTSHSDGSGKTAHK